jgi:hypothetical protein
MGFLLDCGIYERFNVIDWVLAISVTLNDCFIAMLDRVLEATPQRCANS